jgi:tRNA modification GTPase
VPPPHWLVVNKLDTLGSSKINNLKFGSSTIGLRTFLLSALTGTGVDSLVEALKTEAENYFGAGDGVLVTRERHRRHLGAVLAGLGRILQDHVQTSDELVAEELRLAADSLGRLTGRIGVEDVLDAIFRDFCIGK